MCISVLAVFQASKQCRPCADTVIVATVALNAVQTINNPQTPKKESKMKNHFTLLRAIASIRLDEIAAMNLLQDAGIVSDECVAIEDVANEDLERAIEFILKTPPTI